VNSRNRTPSEYISYGLYFYVLGLSLRKAVDRRFYGFIKRNHVSIWNWIQKYNPQKISTKKEKISAYVIDETVIIVGSEFIWVWVDIEPESKEILGMSISKERNMFVVIEQFISDVVDEYGEHPVSTAGGTWYSQACRFLKINHHIHSSYEKSIIERTMQYIKDRTENFDDYLLCRKKKCKLKTYRIGLIYLQIIITGNYV
jgi:putative transposase